MFKKIIWSLLICFIFNTTAFAAPTVEYDPLDQMPILEKIPIGVSLNDSPVEQRGIEFRKFLAASVKIGVDGGSGSGTIIYYDAQKNLAYVASCGHMWSRGTMSAEDGRRKNMKCKVITYYHNEIKLNSPKTYEANVIFYSFIDGQDTSLVTFTPDWKPDYFPIAPVDYSYKFGSLAHSCGCDGGREVAHYDVELLALQGDLVTRRNGPRPGRSGGGLMDDNGYYIGTCWGTQYRDGSGQGYFTPLTVIHRYWSKQVGYDFLLKQFPGGGIARQIPVVDRNNKQGKYDPDYILLPGR